MPSDTLILAMDTSAAHCAAALLSGDRILDARAEAMTRGQAERLFPFVESILSQHNVAWTDLAAIAVGTGPGNFTGLRIAVAAARGLALALKIPAIGVDAFDVIDRHTPQDHLAGVPGPRDQVYIRAPGAQPRLVTMQAATEDIRPLALPPEASLQAELIARIAAGRLGSPLPPPAPLYLRAADAAPPSDPAPHLLRE